jgi:hypothetical protein
MSFKQRLASFIEQIKFADFNATTTLEVVKGTATTVSVSQPDSMPRVEISGVNSYYNATELRRIAKALKALADSIDPRATH